MKSLDLQPATDKRLLCSLPMLFFSPEIRIDPLTRYSKEKLPVVLPYILFLKQYQKLPLPLQYIRNVVPQLH